ncbi:hypothetical protein niasHS_013857 [Heterodera schachtii]|uniref:Protein root UVB sensitive/RUS domain-containing protein n=1 Tax=Heterodera schachtii TaxID=97005 RepID=A0ABD2IRH8_HETSC
MISYFEHNVLTFLRFFASSTTNTFLDNTKENVRISKYFLSNVWPLLRNSIRHLYFHNLAFHRLRQLAPSILNDCPSLCFVTMEGDFHPEFPPDDNANARMVKRWLNGCARLLRTQDEVDRFVLNRYPIALNERKWDKWTLGWNVIDILIGDGGVDDGLLDASSPGPSAPVKMPKQSASQIEAIEQQQQNIVETYNGEPVHEYSFARPRGDGDRLALRKNSLRKRVHSVRAFFAEVFLPQGYPATVSADYLDYQLYDTLQAFASSLNGTLATLAVLKGVGVGNEQATVLAAALTWILKDGVGMLARIAFAWAKGTRLDSDCKRWRLFADLLNDASFFIDGSQETLVNVLSLLCSLVLLPQVEGRPFTIWALFLLFTAVHLFANYRAVKCIQLETLNPNRLTLAVRHFAEYGTVPSVAECHRKEPILGTFAVRRHFGCPLAQLPANIGPLVAKTINASQQTAVTTAGG